MKTNKNYKLMYKDIINAWVEYDINREDALLIQLKYNVTIISLDTANYMYFRDPVPDLDELPCDLLFRARPDTPVGDDNSRK